MMRPTDTIRQAGMIPPTRMIRQAGMISPARMIRQTGMISPAWMIRRAGMVAGMIGSADRGGRPGRLAGLVDGAIAGAVGSTALNVVSYLDMVIRARPASSSPEQSAGRLADAVHIDLGPEDRAANRRSGLGPLLGYATGVACAAAFTAAAGSRRIPLPVAAGLLGAGVMLTSDGSMTALRVTDPRGWSRTDWMSDIVPHLAYGLAAAATLDRLAAARRAGQRLVLRTGQRLVLRALRCG